MSITNCNVRDAYRQAIARVWKLKQKDIKDDIHLGSKAPGRWSDGRAILEIYCERDIPNATDIHCSEFGSFDYSESWVEIDNTANDILSKKFPGNRRRFHSEPVNNAVVCVWES